MDELDTHVVQTYPVRLSSPVAWVLKAVAEGSTNFRPGVL